MSKLFVQEIEGPNNNANRFNDGLTVTAGVSTFVGIVSCNTALLVLGSGGTNNTGIEARANSTQGTDTNKAIRVRNNSATNTFEVSYKGRVDAESFHGDGSNLTGIEGGVAGVSTTGFSTFTNISVGGISTFVGLVTAGNVVSSGIITAKAFIPNEGQLSNRNIIVNGAMQVAQYQSGIGSTNASGYGSVDRFQCNHAGCDESPWSSQEALTSSDSGPWEEGFRHCMQILNGNQSSGAGADDYIRIYQVQEAQTLASCGWNYTSANSYITISYWVRSSVAQTFYTQFASFDGTRKMYYFSTALSANTWTKVSHSLPGHADLSFDFNTNEGWYITWYMFRGTNNTGTVTANQWNNYAAATLTPNQTSTWFTTDNSTFKLTGVQLEVGSVATPFEHRSFVDDQLACQRYFQQIGASGQDGEFCIGASHLISAGDQTRVGYFGPTNLRATPTITEFGDGLKIIGSGSRTDALSMDDINVTYPSTYLQFNATCTDIGDDYEIVVVTNTANGGIYISAEL